MKAHVLLGSLKEFGNFELRESDRLPIYPQVEPSAAVIGCVEDELTHTKITLSITDAIVVESNFPPGSS